MARARLAAAGWASHWAVFVWVCAALPVWAQDVAPADSVGPPDAPARWGLEGPARQSRRVGAPSVPFVEFQVWATADLEGELGPLRCDASPESFRLSWLAGAVQDGVRKSTQEGVDAPIFISAGNLLGMGPFTRFLAQAGNAGAARLRPMLDRLSLDLLVPGPEEQEHADFVLRRLADGAHASRPTLPYQAINLRCREPGTGRCDAVPPASGGGPDDAPNYTLRVRNGVRIALLPLVWPDPALLTTPWEVLAPVSALNRAAQHARTVAAADIVIAVAHIGRPADALPRAGQLARLARGVDAVIVNSLAPARSGGGILSMRFAGDRTPPVFAPAGAKDSWLAVRFRLARRNGRFLLLSTDADIRSAHQPNVMVQRDMLEIQSLYCSAYGAPLGASQWARTMDAEDVAEYVLGVMRTAAEAELATLPRDYLDLDSLGSFSGAITRDFVYRALPRNQLIRRVRVDGKSLSAWLDAIEPGVRTYSPTGVRVIGAERDQDGRWTVNSRQIVRERKYSVAMPDGYAAAGADALPLDDIDDPLTSPPLRLRDTVEQWLQTNRYREYGGTQVEAATNFPVISERALWSFYQDVMGAFSLTRISNPPAYTERPLLDRADFVGLEGNAHLRVDAKSHLHDFSAFATLVYATTRSAEQESFNESKDRIQFEAAYGWKAVRKLAGYSPYVPVPEVRFRLTSELTQSEELGYHHLETTGIVGIKWQLTEAASSGIGYSIGGELLDPQGRPRHGISVYLELLDMPLFEAWGAPLRWQSRLDAFYTDLGRDDTIEALFTAKLSTAIAGPLSLTFGFNGYAFSTRAQAVALAADATIGLQLSSAWWRQTF